MMSLLLTAALAAPPDAPRIVQLKSGDYLVSPQAFEAIDSEMKRLQKVEREHKGEQWVTTVLVSSAVGLLVGALVSGIVVAAAKPAPK